jgi:hypothetical protein
MLVSRSPLSGSRHSVHPQLSRSQMAGKPRRGPAASGGGGPESPERSRRSAEPSAWSVNCHAVISPLAATATLAERLRCPRPALW